MQSTKIVENIQKALSYISTTSPLIKAIVERLDLSRGRALLVGGAVRDLLREKPAKDIDIEVHGLSLHQLEQILKV